MKGKIGLEEHFAMEDTLDDSKPFVPQHLWPEAKARLLDFQEKRIAQMDAWGMEMMLLSLNAPAIQAIPHRKVAMEMAVRSNDLMAGEIAKNPKRFQGLAALALQDPDHSCRELERCVKQLGFRGILVNGFSQIDDPENCVYLDDPRYKAFWATVAQLDVPFYLHPRNPLVSQASCYKGAEWLLGPKWGFGNETAVHALRLMGSGIFDTHPNLKIIIGHMGEGIPFSLWRIDNHNAWMNPAQSLSGQAQAVALFPQQLLDHGVRQFLHAVAGQFDDGNRHGSHSFLDRLAVRECRSRRKVVRRPRIERERQAEDRPYQRAEAVQALIQNAPRGLLNPRGA